MGWISLDEEDDLPGIFWTYLLAGLGRAGADLTGVGMPEDADRIDHSLLVRLSARLSERSAPIVLVLDNAETITRQQICDDLDFLVRHAAGRLRLVLVTGSTRPATAAVPAGGRPRRDPVLRPGLSTGRGAPAALRAASRTLRGRRAGASRTGRAGGPPASGSRTWPTASAARREQDPAVVAASDIALYFRTEVLEAQPSEVRDFLLATSVVRVLVPGLATHLSGLREAEATLHALAQTSVFVEAMPGEDESFRYHPLVRDLLTAQLRQEYPARWRRLNRKAANWLTQRGPDRRRRATVRGRRRLGGRSRRRRPAPGGRPPAGRGPAGDLAAALATLPTGVAGPEAAAVAAAVALVRGDLPGCDKNLLRAHELVPADAGEPTKEIELAASLVALARDRGPAGEAASRPVSWLRPPRCASASPGRWTPPPRPSSPTAGGVPWSPPATWAQRVRRWWRRRRRRPRRGIPTWSGWRGHGWPWRRP